MKVILFPLLFSLSSGVLAQDKIVGGSLVDPTVVETTHIVSVGDGCSGSIIAAKWILTAAHCAPIFGRFVTAGSNNLKSKERIKLEVKKGHPHPDYNEKTYKYDIALIELKYPIHFENMGLRKIQILTPEMHEAGIVAPGVIGTATGWGSIREGGNYSNLLMQVELPIVSYEVANATNSYKGLIDETMIPAGFAAGKKDSCQGDSGGPFTVFNCSTTSV